MSIRVDIKRSEFFKELNKDSQTTYFDLKEKNIIPKIDNIYLKNFTS